MCWTPSFAEYYDHQEPLPTKGKKRVSGPSKEVTEVFEYFKSVFNLRSRLPATNEINALLKIYSVQDLKDAALNASKSSFFMENNATRGPKWFYGKADRVEYYLNAKPEKVVAVVNHEDAFRRINERTQRQEVSAKSTYVDDLPWS